MPYSLRCLFEAVLHRWPSCTLPHPLVVGALVALMASQAYAACTAVSTKHTVAVAELYTSEGCDSCPPADRWLSGLAARGLTTDKVIPLGLHVDYWDYIGWKDIYAKPVFTARQRAQARLANSTVVYTPQVMLQGRDFRGWAGGGFESAVKAINARPARADIALSVSRQEASVNVQASVARANGAEVYLALVQSRLVSQVKAGENRGATLRHDHVVRDWIGPLRAGADGTLRLERTLTAPKPLSPNDLGVVALVQDGRSGEVLQALQLNLCS